MYLDHVQPEPDKILSQLSRNLQFESSHGVCHLNKIGIGKNTIFYSENSAFNFRKTLY